MTTDGSLLSGVGIDVLVEEGRPVLVGHAQKAAGDADFLVIRYVATIVFEDGFE